MFKHLPKLAIGLSVLAAVEIVSLATAPSASAFNISGTSITALTSTDIGKAFEIDFNGNVDTNNVSGLSSSALFTFKGFGSASGGNTNAIFDIILKNTSSGGIQSRVSAIGFNTNKTEMSGSTAALSESTALFSGAKTGGSFPNQFGNIDICFTNGNTCQGGASGGVTNYQPGNNDGIYQEGSFTGTVKLSGSVTSLNLGNFGVRYQSIDGNGFNGASGTGRATTIRNYDPTPGPVKIPEPATTAALGLFAASALGTRKRKSLAQA